MTNRTNNSPNSRVRMYRTMREEERQAPQERTTGVRDGEVERANLVRRWWTVSYTGWRILSMLQIEWSVQKAGAVVTTAENLDVHVVFSLLPPAFFQQRGGLCKFSSSAKG